MTWIRCKRCVMPSTRPDTPFIDGVCAACISFEQRKIVDWDERKSELEALLERAKNSSGFDCIVPSSGGKDSTWQALTLIAMGAKPLIVTATTCHLTPLGRANIDNLAKHATTIEVTPKRSVRKALNRLGLQLVGDISWPEHASIFTTPLRMAANLGIPLIFYGENPQNQYGGPMGTEQAKQMTRRWVTEFGGFLGLRPRDFVGQAGIVEEDMVDYELPPEKDVKKVGVEAHFLGAYLPWDSLENAKVARANGFVWMPGGKPPADGNLWPYENLDNAQTGLHDHMMYRKFGYGRLCAQASVDVRCGRMSRADALKLVEERDGAFPFRYAGVDYETVIGAIGMNSTEFDTIADKFTNKELFAHVENQRPILHEFAEE